jgi:O-antigen/teichoic acid export membrane protein
VVFAVTLRVVVGGLLPAVFLGVVLAPVAVVWIFGPAYSEAVLVLRILMGYVALTLVNSVFSCALIGGGFEREYGRAVIAGVVVVVAAVTVLTPFAGMMGAAIGVGIGEGATLGLMVRAVLRHLQLPVRIAVGRMVIAALAMSLTPLVLNWLHPGFQSLVGVAVYIVALLLLRELEPGSMSDFRRRLA